MSSQLNDIQRAASEQFGRQSHRYAKGHILENVEDVQEGLRHIALPARARVLDIATGAGYTGIYLASLGHDVTLSDLTEPMLQRARELAASRGLTVRLSQHAAESLPYENDSFDLITCRVAAHHFSSPPQFVAEVARVLAPGGYFLLIDGTVQDGEPEAEAWLHQVEKLRDPSHHRFLTPKTWGDLCASSDLAVQATELNPKKQPDLNWYFETAATTPENRAQVLGLVENAPSSARKLFSLTNENGKIAWWWQILTLVARKNKSV